jgi:rhodanese-related sulfurtransferase
VAGGPRGREDPRRSHARGMGLHRARADGDEHPLRLPRVRLGRREEGFPWEFNPHFVELVKARFAREDTILVSCRSGGRAAIAIDMLAAAGFTNAYNILDGMEGSRVDDPESVFHGMRLRNGWKASGLPWTYDLDPGRMALPERETGTLHPGNTED